MEQTKRPDLRLDELTKSKKLRIKKWKKYTFIQGRYSYETKAEPMETVSL